MEKSFRCGWCGHPTDANGEPLRDISQWVEKGAELLNGNCCPPQETRMIVTRDMAIDAQDMSLEGTEI
jgi:hypothetical protein